MPVSISVLPVAATWTWSAMSDSIKMAEIRRCHAAAASVAGGRLGLYGVATAGAVATGAATAGGVTEAGGGTAGAATL